MHDQSLKRRSAARKERLGNRAHDTEDENAGMGIGKVGNSPASCSTDTRRLLPDSPIQPVAKAGDRLQIFRHTATASCLQIWRALCVLLPEAPERRLRLRRAQSPVAGAQQSHPIHAGRKVSVHSGFLDSGLLSLSWANANHVFNVKMLPDDLHGARSPKSICACLHVCLERSKAPWATGKEGPFKCCAPGSRTTKAP